ncbi:MAG: enoyl-CoA hydratase/carnithine racemase [Rhodospirillaceae bacterium]|nr:MAG: enoyl-CoA hydratase/carnithine racemase [Rhodospirillaceae bacterium]
MKRWLLLAVFYRLPLDPLRIFGAEEVATLGLVHRVVADDRVGEEAAAVAKRITVSAPLVHRWHRRFVHRLLAPQPITVADMDECYRFFASEDYREGLTAFREKRLPRVQGTVIQFLTVCPETSYGIA